MHLLCTDVPDMSCKWIEKSFINCARIVDSVSSVFSLSLTLPLTLGIVWASWDAALSLSNFHDNIGYQI